MLFRRAARARCSGTLLGRAAQARCPCRMPRRAAPAYRCSGALPGHDAQAHCLGAARCPGVLPRRAAQARRAGAVPRHAVHRHRSGFLYLLQAVPYGRLGERQTRFAGLIGLFGCQRARHKSDASFGEETSWETATRDQHHPANARFGANGVADWGPG